MLTIPTLQIADIELPARHGAPARPGLRPLVELVAAATRLFTWIDPDHWRRYHNPVELLINVEPHHWQRLLSDPEFVQAYEAVIARAGRSTTRGERWWSRHAGDALRGPVAYFSMEFGLHESLGVYSGGLGVLAGDHARPPPTSGIPLVGVSLLYRSGYFRQTVDARRLPAAHLPRLRLRAPARPARAGARRAAC